MFGFFKKEKTPAYFSEQLAHADAEVLREHQRLMQIATMDRWMQGMLVESRRKRRWAVFFRLFLFLIIVGSLINSAVIIHGMRSTTGPTERHIGMVKVEGVIDATGEANASRVLTGLRRALREPMVEAVILKINSPGGSPAQSQRMFEEIRHLRERHDKPVVAWIGDIGASGAYYIAAASDQIYAAPSSLVGSIGVISQSFGFQDAMANIGIERRVVTSGESKSFLDPFMPMQQEDREFWEGVLGDTHAQFVRDVVDGRGDRLDGQDLEYLFSGLVWTANQGVALGLVDGIVSFDALSRQLFDAEEASVRDYTPRRNPFENLGQGIMPFLTQLVSGSPAYSPVRMQAF